MPKYLPMLMSIAVIGGMQTKIFILI